LAIAEGWLACTAFWKVTIMQFRTAFAAVMLAGCATADQVKQLEDKVKTLEEKVDKMEKARPGTPAPADPAKEQAAEKLFTEMNDALTKGDIEGAKGRLATLTKDYPETTAAKKAKKAGAELEVVGKAVPADWKGSIEKWYQGESNVDLNSGVTLVVFWEVWCPHCKREVPNLKTTFDKFNSKGLDVVGLTKVTRSATEEKVLEFIKEQAVTYPIAKENGKLSELFNVSGIPAAAVVKDGKIVWRGHPARLTDEMINAWLGAS
jgi:outer membrane murein-binding lipoprotein Lpp/thiol-disulfide isomerase/thioredoxin